MNGHCTLEIFSMRWFILLLASHWLCTHTFAQDKVPELPRKIAFGPTHVVTLWEDDPRLGDCLIDFEKNKRWPSNAIKIDGPHSNRFRQIQKWAIDNGIDAYCEVKQSFAGLMGFNIVALPVREGDWEPSYFTMEQLKQTDIGYPCPIAASRRLPATWIFRTTESYGVLQILDVIDHPDYPKQDGSGIKIRYKLVKQSR